MHNNKSKFDHIFETDYIVRHSLNLGCVMYLLKRLKEPSSIGGIGLIFTGIASVMTKDYATGMAQIVTGVTAVFLKEKGNND